MTWDERMPDYVHNADQIKGFFGDYRWLSNFHVCEVEHEGILYHSSEAAYQAAKTLDMKIREEFVDMTPSESKKAGRGVEMRKDWEEVKRGVMLDVLMDKFTRNPALKAGLIATGDRWLEEANWWNDTYWGTCKGVGSNELGRALILVRKAIKP